MENGLEIEGKRGKQILDERDGVGEGTEQNENKGMDYRKRGNERMDQAYVCVCVYIYRERERERERDYKIMAKRKRERENERTDQREKNERMDQRK